MVLDRSCDVSRDAPTDRRRTLGGTSWVDHFGCWPGWRWASRLPPRPAVPPAPYRRLQPPSRTKTSAELRTRWSRRPGAAGRRWSGSGPGSATSSLTPTSSATRSTRPRPARFPPTGPGRSSARYRGGRQPAPGPGRGHGRRGRRPGRLDRRHPSTPAPARFRHLTRRSTLLSIDVSGGGSGCRQRDPSTAAAALPRTVRRGSSGFRGVLSTSILRSIRGW